LKKITKAPEKLVKITNSKERTEFHPIHRRRQVPSGCTWICDLYQKNNLSLICVNVQSILECTILHLGLHILLSGLHKNGWTARRTVRVFIKRQVQNV